jgi:hypothetical protein
MNAEKTGKRFQTAGLLLLVGLVALLLTLMWEHPTSFLVSLGLGGGALFLGIALYLHTIVTVRS